MAYEERRQDAREEIKMVRPISWEPSERADRRIRRANRRAVLAGIREGEREAARLRAMNAFQGGVRDSGWRFEFTPAKRHWSWAERISMGVCVAAGIALAMCIRWLMIIG